MIQLQTNLLVRIQLPVWIHHQFSNLIKILFFCQRGTVVWIVPGWLLHVHKYTNRALYSVHLTKNQNKSLFYTLP